MAAGSWEALGLDGRLARAAVKLGLARPNLLQGKTVPIALQGKDILCRAKTGSGKTAAYCMPMLQRILAAKTANPDAGARVRGLVLVPTRELSEQVRDTVKALSLYCAQQLSCVQLAADVTVQSQRALLADTPDIIVTTPARIVAHINAGTVNLKDSLEVLVVDEADLVLSYGYEDDVRAVLGHAPKIYQAMLMSATVSTDVDELKQLLLRNAAIIRLEEGDANTKTLAEHFVYCEDPDKFLYLYFILQMRLLPGKGLVFVNDVDRGYRVRLFLEQFGIRSCVLNAELPQNSRYHIVQEFNRGAYDYIIATDEATVIAADKPEAVAKKPKKGKGARAPDADYGVSRGVDFRDVAVVFNFDLPASAIQYRHRVGRTARAGKSGTALTFVSASDRKAFLALARALGAQTGTPAPAQPRRKRSRRDDDDKDDEKADEEAEDDESENAADDEEEEDDDDEEPTTITPLVFKTDDVNAFRYRATDALRAVTKVAIREARLKEIRHELLTSEKLKAHFEDNVRDLAALRHDKPLQTVRVQAHLKHVPGYLMPSRDAPTAATATSSAGSSGPTEGLPAATTPSAGTVLAYNYNADVGLARPARGVQKRKHMLKRVVNAARKRNADPLKSFSYAGAGSASRRRK